MKTKFIPNNNDLSYYPLLYKALEATKDEIIEMGTGYGSTPLLHYYATKNKRKLFSYETKNEWLSKFEKQANEFHEFTLLDMGSWDACSNMHSYPSVVFIDHAPGERRKEDIIKFKDKSEIIVIHDTEPNGAGDYQVRQHFNKFKYCVEITSTGAWATALSNTIDITEWIGEKFGNYIITKYWTGI